MSQTNSASGYPLNYLGLDPARKLEILHAKVTGMIAQGLQNAADLDIPRFVSYAGYASVHVKGKPEYFELGIVPTAQYIREELGADPRIAALLGRVDILDFYPGDVLDMATGSVAKAFVSSQHYADEDLKAAATRYYERYAIVDGCDTFADAGEALVDPRRLDFFLNQLGDFALRKTEGDDAPFQSIRGKSFEIRISDTGVQRRIVFGEGLVPVTPDSPLPSKRLHVGAALMNQVLDGRILFENLYTGYEAEWERFPAHVYNRDIVMFVVMYSYLYKNRLAPQNT
jgi:hypothetical protein